MTFESLQYTKPVWERACSRRRQFRSCLQRLTQRFREQARSHNWTYLQYRTSFSIAASARNEERLLTLCSRT
ncbi:hypothetical protein DMX04_12205 [Pseudomonas koreensis]|nr:hypothetical protein DMX04_12205 [Pseudomonas koreensis]